jgi:hypothetical protein
MSVKYIPIRGCQIVCLEIAGKERVSLSQISNTLLHGYSYNEIHNRRVALGKTFFCVSATKRIQVVL